MSAVCKGQTVRLEITDFGVNGEGVGKHGEFVVFVENAVPGDVVDAEITKLKKNYGFGRALEIIKPSPNRCEPLCKSFAICGGCGFQSINYETELKYKKMKVNNAIKRIGGIELIIDEIVAMEKPYHYRNKAVYHVCRDNGRLRIGFFGGKSNKIADASSCVITDVRNAEITEAFMKYMEESGVQPYDEKTGKGDVEALMIRNSSFNADVLISVISACDRIKNPAGLVYHLKNADNNIKGVTLLTRKGKAEGAYKASSRFVWGENFITEKIGSFMFNISDVSFFQINPEMAHALFGKVKEFAGLTKNDTVIDAYAGTGAISVFVSESAGKVIAVELNDTAAEDAVKNFEQNGITNVTVINGDAAGVFTELYEKGEIPSCVILDPPRSGCEKQSLDALSLLKPSKIVYVSCDPATLSRDLKCMAGFGYKAVKGVCIDMFARCSHIETVVLLTR